MADVIPSPNNFRMSGIYVPPDLEGYLEKKGSGVIGRKTKIWCSIQGALMYLKKSQGVMDSLNLSEAHQVKKVASDSTGSSFEIFIKKKSYVFVCATSDECSQWVKALHNAMAQKDTGVKNSTLFEDGPTEHRTDPTKYESIYSTIADGTEQCKTKQNESHCKLLDYSSPLDAKVETNGDQEPDYYYIKNQSTVPESSLSKNGVYEDIAGLTVATSSANNQHETEVYDDAYTLPNKPEDIPEVIPKLRQSVRATSANPGTPVPCNVTIVVTDERTEGAASEEGVDEEGDDPLTKLVAALSLDESPLPNFQHPLTEADRKPLTELSDFLSNNQPLCRGSYSAIELDSAEDPIANFKMFLKQLNLPS